MTTELDQLGFYDNRVQQTEAYLVPLGLAPIRSSAVRATTRREPSAS